MLTTRVASLRMYASVRCLTSFADSAPIFALLQRSLKGSAVFLNLWFGFLHTLTTGGVLILADICCLWSHVGALISPYLKSKSSF